MRSVADVAECLTATRPRSEELRTVTAVPHKPSENQAMMECALDSQTFFAEYYERTICCWYCKTVTDKTLAICTRSLAGNLRLWRITANVSSEGESGFYEAGMGHSRTRN